MNKTVPNEKSDDEVLAMIQHGGQSRMKAIDMIYQNQEQKEKVMLHVRKMGGDQHEAQDVFHEGIIILDRNIRAGKFNRQTSIDGYLYGICRNVWNNTWRKKSKTSGNEILPHQVLSEDEATDALYSDDQLKYINQLLNLIDDGCKKILTLWKASYSMQEIADQCNLSSAAMAKKYRYRCMKKLMIKLDENKSLAHALRNV